MENFKEIAEKCLAGELSGTFVTAFDNNWHSSYLQRYAILGHEMPEQYVLGPGVIYNAMGQCESRKQVKIIDFIPDNMQEQIKIDIPEGKVPVMEQTEKGVVITWKEKELTCSEIYIDLFNKDQHISAPRYCNVNDNSRQFNKKVEVLRKLTNIRNYFGKPKHNTYGYVLYYTIERGTHTIAAFYPSNDQSVIFDTKEHAEQAIKMLGDELKYLFEPW